MFREVVTKVICYHTVLGSRLSFSVQTAFEMDFTDLRRAYGLEDDSSSEEEAAAIATGVIIDEELEIQERYGNRQHWILSTNSDRAAEGDQFQKLYEQLNAHPKEFYRYFRMSKDTFLELLEILRPYITKKDTVMRPAIKPEERLALTLR